MISKSTKLFALIFAVLLLSTGCAKTNSVNESDVVGKTYTYENDGFGGDFRIEIKSDGTFTYYEGLLSSYYGFGNWTLEGDTILLSDDAQGGKPRENYFKVEGNDLIFQSENSSNFLYLDIADGDRFLGAPT